MPLFQNDFLVTKSVLSSIGIEWSGSTDYSLEDLNLDSIEYMTLFLNIEKAYSINDLLFNFEPSKHILVSDLIELAKSLSQEAS